MMFYSPPSMSNSPPKSTAVEYGGLLDVDGGQIKHIFLCKAGYS